MSYLWTKAVSTARRRPAEVLLVVFGLFLAGRFLLPQLTDVSRVYFFAEYPLKIVPFFTDANFKDYWDVWALGDPRPRVATIVAQAVNLKIRNFLPLVVQWHPGFGLSWLLYPFVIAQVYRTFRLWRSDRVMAAAAALLWAFSPPALDSLALCYLPAKALMNLWFALAFRFASEAFGSPDIIPNRRRTALLMLAFVNFAALLTDETAWVQLIALGVFFWPTLDRASQPSTAVTIAPFVLPVVGLLVVTFVIFPAVNRKNGQVPLNYIDVIAHGPSSAMLGSANANPQTSSHFTNAWGKINPLYLGYVALSAHLVPWRQVPGFWTYSRPIPPAEWPLNEVAFLAVVFAIGVALASRLARPWRHRAVRLTWSIIAMVVAYSVLNVPLAPAILEVNYYGALFSLPFALLFCVLFFGTECTRVERSFAVASVALVSWLQATGYEATNRRTQAYFADGGLTSGHPASRGLTREIIREIKTNVAAGQFGAVVEKYRFPSPGFCLAFEWEAARPGRVGRFDYLPGEKNRTPSGILLSQQRQWLLQGGAPLGPLLSETTRASALAAGGVEISPLEWSKLCRAGGWHGQGEDWIFTRVFATNGTFTERYWPRTATRIWRQTGAVHFLSTEPTLQFAGSLYNQSGLRSICRRPDGAYLAFDGDGICRLQFRLVPAVAL